MRDLEQLASRAAGASERVMVIREDARAEALEAIRMIEQNVQRAIAGDCLRGLPDLCPYMRSTHFRAVQVQVSEFDRFRGSPLRPTKGALVLDVHGELRVFEVPEHGDATTRPARDEDLKAQDLQGVVDTVAWALDRHTASAEKTAGNYQRILELSKAIRGALEVA